MRKVWKLGVAFFFEHPVRVLLTTIATVAAACMVIWIASGYDAMLKTFDVYSNLALGRYPLAIAPISKAEGQFVPPEVVEELKADPNLAVVDPMWAGRVNIRPVKPTPPPIEEPRLGRTRGFGGPGRPRIPLLLGTNSTEAPFDISEGRWIDPSRTQELEVAVRTDVAQRLGLKVGDEVVAGDGEAELKLQVIGLVGAPSLGGAGGNAAMKILTPSSGEYYVTMPVAERIAGAPLQISLVGVGLNPEADLTRFRFGWAPRLNRFSTPVQFQEAHDIEEALDEAEAARNVQMQSFAVTAIAMLVAFLVIFCTLSMGVSERIRQFAVLRAVVLTRFQVVQLITLESMFLAMLGLTGGVAAGWLVLQLTARTQAKTLYHGASLGANSLLLAAVAVFGGALFAALIPAIRATRVRPMDAMSQRPQLTAAKGLPIKQLIAGVILLAVNPVLAFLFPPKFDAGVIASMVIGFVFMMAGFVLLAPVVVLLVDRWVSPLLSRLLGISPKLLASQLTNHLWRTVGAAVSMALGMGLYIGVQVWGFTMLDGFVPGPWAPDALVAFRPHGISPEGAEQVASIPGIDNKRWTALVAEQPRLLGDITRSADRASVTRQDNVVIVGLDPVVAFGGDRPLLKVEWANGNAKDAIAKIEEGRGCVVPDHFLTETGLKVGDSFELVPPENSANPVRYEIAGAVRLSGWHWQTKTTGLRPRTHRAAALIFAKYQTVAKDFDLPTASHIWFDYATPNVDPDEIAAAAKSLYVDKLQQKVAVDGKQTGELSVRVMPVEGIREATRSAAKRWIWIVSQIPLIALAISSFGVLNVMLASVRARRWEMGILRSLGFTRWTIIRTVLAEGLLIGFVAALLSLGFGVMAGWCGCEFSQYISFFGGMHPSLVVPLLPVVVGLTSVVLLTFLTAIWPAVDIGKTRPLTLLQRGRGAF